MIIKSAFNELNEQRINLDRCCHYEPVDIVEDDVKCNLIVFLFGDIKGDTLEHFSGGELQRCELPRSGGITWEYPSEQARDFELEQIDRFTAVRVFETKKQIEQRNREFCVNCQKDITKEKKYAINDDSYNEGPILFICNECNTKGAIK